MPCANCKYYDDNERWGSKGYCSYYRQYDVINSKSDKDSIYKAIYETVKKCVSFVKAEKTKRHLQSIQI